MGKPNVQAQKVYWNERENMFQFEEESSYDLLNQSIFDCGVMGRVYTRWIQISAKNTQALDPREGCGQPLCF